MSHKILAVDDHPETLDIVVKTLQHHGYEVVSSLSPVEGLQLAQDELPDLALLDVNMPEMDGLEVCRRMRAIPKLANMPVIMFTAEDEPYQKLAGFDAGADDYLTKPTDPDEMIARIEGLLGEVKESEEEPEAEGQATPEGLFYTAPDKGGVTKVAAPPEGCMIAVLGVRGGAGATLTAINLAASIARMSRPCTLVDMDMQQGHISLYLNRHITGSINTLADIPAEDIGKWLPQQAVELSQHLQLLLAHPNQDGRFPHLSASQTAVILDTLIQSGQSVVVDMGREQSDAHRLILERADQALVCLSPERIALSGAKHLLSQYRKNLAPFTTVNAIIFDVGGQMVLPRKAVETYLEHSLQAVIAISPKELTQAVNKGAILVGTYAQGQTAKQFYQLARQLVKK